MKKVKLSAKQRWILDFLIKKDQPLSPSFVALHYSIENKTRTRASKRNFQKVLDILVDYGFVTKEEDKYQYNSSVPYPM